MSVNKEYDEGFKAGFTLALEKVLGEMERVETENASHPDMYSEWVHTPRNGSEVKGEIETRVRRLQQTKFK